jgi:hypothetical protein
MKTEFIMPSQINECSSLEVARYEAIKLSQISQDDGHRGEEVEADLKTSFEFTNVQQEVDVLAEQKSDWMLKFLGHSIAE